MRKIVHGVNAPVVAGAMVLGVQYAVHHGIAHIQIGRRHVDLRPKHARAIRKFAGLHALQKFQILFRRALTVWACPARFGQSTAVLANLLLAEVIHIRLAIKHELPGKLVQLSEVVRRIKLPVIPVEAEPAHVFLLRFDILHTLLGRVSVVESKVAQPAKLPRQPEVQADGLGVPDVQVAVRLRGKSCMYAPVEPAGFVVGDYCLLYEVGRCGRFVACHGFTSFRVTDTLIAPIPLIHSIL